MFKITPQKLVEWLNKYRGGCRICSVTMKTPLEMNKFHRDNRKIPNPFLGKIDHLSERLVFWGTDYEDMINRIRRQVSCDIPEFKADALWGGKGRHLNKFMVEHVEKHQLYLYLLYTALKSDDDWVDKSLKQEQWLDHQSGEIIAPNWEEWEPFLPPKATPSLKQGCRSVDIEIENDGKSYTLPAGLIPKEVRVRMPKLENVVQIRSFDLRQKGKFEILDLGEK